MLHPFCQCWTSFVAGAVMLRPKLTREKMPVHFKDVLRSQLCRARETTLLRFWSQSHQWAVALASVWSVTSSSLLGNRPVTGITEEMPEAGCNFGNKYARCGGCF